MSFWKRPAAGAAIGPPTPPDAGTVAPGEKSQRLPVVPMPDLPGRATPSLTRAKRLGTLPHRQEAEAAAPKSTGQMVRDARDVLRIMRRRPLPSLVGLAMDAKDLMTGGPGPLPSADPAGALAVLRDPEQAMGLETPPIYVRPAEKDGVNRHAFELGRRHAEQGGRVPLRQELDPRSRYLWAMTAPKVSGEAPGIHIGIEYAETDAQGRTDKLGHPSILNASLGPGGRHQAVFAGELVHDKGRWVIDNNSGRWFGSNVRGLKQLGLHKRDLFAAAAHHINGMSDLDIREAKQYSHNPLRFVEQLIGAHPPRAVSLAPEAPEASSDAGPSELKPP